MNSYIDKLIDLFLNEEKPTRWNPEAARQKAGVNRNVKVGAGREESEDVAKSPATTKYVNGRWAIGSGRGGSDTSEFQPHELSAPTNMDALKAVSREDINFYSTAMDKYERQGMSGVQAAEAVVKQYGLVHWLLQWAKDNEKRRGSGRGKKKKKINKPLSDSIDRLLYLLEDVATEILTGGEDNKTVDDLSDAGKRISKYSNDLEKIHSYLRNNFKTITQMVGGNFQKGIKANLTQGIDGIGRSNAMLVGAVNDANKTNKYGQLVGSDGKQVIGTDGKPIDSDTFDNGYVKDSKWRQKQATQAGGAAPEQTRRAG